MSKNTANTRKLDHIALALEQKDKGPISAGWETVHLKPIALPKINPEDVDLSTEFLGSRLNAPLMIAGMTGGHEGVAEVNRSLAIAADHCNIAMGVGSQRAALENPALAQTYSVVRDHAPNAFICGNIGISQIANGSLGSNGIVELVGMVKADAMAVHLNVLQELIQPEGQIELQHAYAALAEFVKHCPVPVIVKETGCGLDEKTAKRLSEIGVAAFDVGGAGGTSFVSIEGARAASSGENRKARLAETFRDWGLTTVSSLAQLRSLDMPVIATGGIRNGLDAAKAIALGADMVGIGSQMLAAAIKGPQAAIEELENIISELRIAHVLTECRTVSALQAVDTEAE